MILIDSGGSRNWIPDFIDELESFPDGKADQVDATSGAFNKLTLGNTSRPMASPNQSMPGAAGTTGTTGTPAPPNAAMPPSAAGGAMGASPHDVYPGPGTQGRTGGASGLIGGTPGSGLLGGQPGAGNTSGLLGTTGKQGNGLLGMPGRPRG